MKDLRRPLLVSLALGAGLWVSVAWWHWWPLGAAIVLIWELVWPRRRPSPSDWLLGVAGLTTVLLLYSYPVSLMAKSIIAILYVAWRTWLLVDEDRIYASTFVSQVAVLEAIFVWAAVSGANRGLVALFTWVASFVIARRLAVRLAPDIASVLAAAWALVAAELGWILSAWLVTYVLLGESILVPQAVLVIGGVGYCCGNIFAAQRQGILSRTRLLEYILIGAVIIAIVVAGTSWKATI